MNCDFNAGVMALENELSNIHFCSLTPTVTGYGEKNVFSFRQM